MDKNVLDFLIIGAQKAGTTSLFKYLHLHPQIHMPLEKEAPFFDRDERFSRGWEWYLREFFGGAPVDKLWGEASPEYMADPRVPQRIKSIIPDVKLIALLRHPIERAYSHYRMSVRKGYEKRSFEDVANELLQVDALDQARQRPDQTNSYIVRGEYSRILTTYYGLFPHQQIGVFFTEELRGSPREVLKSIFHLLEVNADFVPPNLGVIYHKGGTKRRLPWLEDLMRIRIVRGIWKRLIPGKHRRPLAYWFFQWNTMSDGEQSEKIPPSVQELLVRHYEKDVAELPTLIGRSAPWVAWN